MRKITWLLLLIGMMSMAQIKGNRQIESRIFSVKGLTDLERGLYAKVEIDQSANEEMTIITDQNLFDLIDIDVVNGTLKLVQKEWIRPSQDIVIKIGMPLLKRVQVSVHETVVISNINKDNISLLAINGKIIAMGEVNSVGFGAENGVIDAGNLEAKQAILNIWGDGKAIVNVSEELESTLSEDARIELVGTPKRLKGDVKKLRSKIEEKANKDLQWIQFKIKNNSSNRNHFVVRGPKSDGSKFGYGFPMMPQSVRKEKWSVGTKVYLKSKLGLNRLLVTIKKEDNGKTVKLFD